MIYFSLYLLYFIFLVRYHTFCNKQNTLGGFWRFRLEDFSLGHEWWRRLQWRLLIGSQLPNTRFLLVENFPLWWHLLHDFILIAENHQIFVVDIANRCCFKMLHLYNLFYCPKSRCFWWLWFFVFEIFLNITFNFFYRIIYIIKLLILVFFLFYVSYFCNKNIYWFTF